jgi:hypothetical protein
MAVVSKTSFGLTAKGICLNYVCMDPEPDDLMTFGVSAAELIQRLLHHGGNAKDMLLQKIPVGSRNPFRPTIDDISSRTKAP